MRDDNRLVETVDLSLLEESAEDLYENAPCGYLSTSADGTIIRVNRTFLDWTGYRREDVVGIKRFPDLLTVGGRMYYETHYAPLLQMQGTVQEIAVELTCADGDTLPTLVSSVLKRDGSGRPVLIRTTVFSARGRREYERQLLRARQSAEESEERARLLARTLQDSFLPPALPEIPGLQVGGVYRPAGKGDEVGGDFYDVFETSGGEWAVVLGDVAGKGAEAAGITALARYTVRAASIRTVEPRGVLETLNKALVQHGSPRFCTAVHCRIRATEPGKFQIVLAVGGHPLPLLMKEGKEPFHVGRPGMLLGAFEDPLLEHTALELGSGDTLFLYTDGVTEGRRDREFFGDEKLNKALALRSNKSADDIVAGIADEVLDFQRGLPRDDIAMVAIRVP